MRSRIELTLRPTYCEQEIICAAVRSGTLSGWMAHWLLDRVGCSAMLPNRLVATMMLRRGARLYLIARVAISGLIVLSGDDPFRLPVSTTVGVLFTCITLGYVEMYRNHERDLLGNLGIKRRSIAGFFLVPALVGELIVRGVAAAV